MKSQISVWPHDAPSTDHSAERARLWPVVLLFVAFTTLPAACHWRFPDPRDPVLESSTTQAPHATNSDMKQETGTNPVTVRERIR